MAATSRVFHAREGAPSRLHGRVQRRGRELSRRRASYPVDDPPAARGRRAGTEETVLTCPSSTRTTSHATDPGPTPAVGDRRGAVVPTGRPCWSGSSCCSAASSSIVALLIFVVNGCRNSAQENALKDYNSDVASIVRDSDSQVGKPFFDLLRNPSTGDLATQIAGYKVAGRPAVPAGQADLHARRHDRGAALVPDRDGDAPRRPRAIADQVRTALSSDTEAADRAINEIAGAMQMFLTSDVIYSDARDPAHRERAARRRRRRPAAPADASSCPGIEWLAARHGRRRARPAALGGRQRRRRRRPRAGARPARHGDRLRPGRRPDARGRLRQPDRLRPGHRVHRQLHQPGRERRGRHRRGPADRGRPGADPRDRATSPRSPPARRPRRRSALDTPPPFDTP